MNGPATAFSQAGRHAVTPADGFRRLETLFSAVIVVWIVAGTMFPDYVFRTIEGTLPAFAAIIMLAGIVTLRSGFRIRIEAPDIAIYFFMLAGVTSLILSLFDYPVLSSFPRDERFIVRQAYFLVLLPMSLMAGQVLWHRFYGSLTSFAVRYFVPLSLALMVGDWLTGFYLGDAVFAEFNDYNLYLEKGTIWLIFGFLYLARVMLGRGSPWLPLAILLAYYGGSLALGYGSLFQATTGSIVFVVLFISTLLSRNFGLAGLAAVGMFSGLAALLAAGTIYPEILITDFNAWWRFTGWQSNFAALYDSGLLGAGFGTPYRPVASDNLEHAVRVAQSGREAWTGHSQPYDLIYLRTQHNSFVNMFFRTGLVGGLAFLLFNVGLLIAGLRMVARGEPTLRPHLLLAMFLLVMGTSEIALHVGLETPRFLIAYALSAALLGALLYGRRDPPGARPIRTAY